MNDRSLRIPAIHCVVVSGLNPRLTPIPEA
jgi:hypothetical protein